MHDPTNEPLVILKWGKRALYALLFISLMVVMGYWHAPFTFAFLGAIGSLLYVGFVWTNKEEEEPERVIYEPNFDGEFIITKEDGR